MYFVPVLDLTSGVLVCGGKHRNRATHGDVVAVELLPKSEWRGKVTALSEGQAEERSSEGSGTMPTGETPHYPAFCLQSVIHVHGKTKGERF